MDYKEQAVLNKAIASEWKNDICISRIGGMNPQEFFALNATAITDLLARAEAAEARAEKAERERDAAIQYMRKTFGWCTGCVHFTGIYGSGCKIGEMSTCGEENNRYVFCKEE